MNNLFVLIKGDKFQAANACAERGIPFVFKYEHRPMTDKSFVETSGLVPASFHDEIAKWFISNHDEAPFPAGTVLHYSFKD
jgi:hypothetical protein